LLAPSPSPDRERADRFHLGRCTLLICALLAFPAACGPSFDRYHLLLINESGASGRSCGVIERGESPEATASCAQEALAAGSPFFVVFEVQGIDSHIFRGLAVNDRGEATFAQWDSDGYGGSRGPFKKPWIRQASCPAPTVTAEPPFIHCDQDEESSLGNPGPPPNPSLQRTPPG
jgi:hypothetical protein